MTEIKSITVIATGGTIASSNTGRGAVASKGAEDVVGGVGVDDIQVHSRDLMRVGSYVLTHRDMRLIAEAVSAELARDDVDGVVITHGTDTMEETAFLLDAVHATAKPVVLTGAQRTADDPAPDGPQNLGDAIRVAASPAAHGCGALIVFAGRIHLARGVRKHHTRALDAFSCGDIGPIGYVGDGHVAIGSRPIRPATLPLPTTAFDQTRVDVVNAYPGADAALAEAAVDAGAHGVLIAGTGTGNANHALVNWVEMATRQGIVVGLSTRVAHGPVVPIYGNGGGVDLQTAGAIGMGAVPVSQARILLALLISAGADCSPQAIAPYV